MNTTTKKLFDNFYQGMQKQDSQAINLCYHQDTQFEDPVFGRLDYENVTTMWTMLMERAQDFSVEYTVLEAEENRGKVRWIAKYLFSKTGKKITNIVTSEIELKEGKIIHQVDTFNLRKWIGMALGFKGILTGWIPAVQNKVKTQAKKGLEHYKQKH